MSRFENRPKRSISQKNLEEGGKNIFFEDGEAPTKTIDPDHILRQTYYISEQQRAAISFMAFHEGQDKSQIVRNALDAYIPKMYMRMALYK